MDIKQYWTAVLHQDAAAIRTFFACEAWVNWHNTNEHFNVEEFIRANCEYPGEWDGEIEQAIYTPTHIITAVHVCTMDRKSHFHVTSFIRVEREKILSIDEYWGDDGPAPRWRQALNIGCPIA